MFSALPLIADIARRGRHVSKVPQTDSCTAAKLFDHLVGAMAFHTDEPLVRFTVRLPSSDRKLKRYRPTSYARWDNGHEDNSPENGTCRTIA